MAPQESLRLVCGHQHAWDVGRGSGPAGEMIDIQNHLRNEGLLNLFDGQSRVPSRNCVGVNPLISANYVARLQLWDAFARQIDELKEHDNTDG